LHVRFRLRFAMYPALALCAVVAVSAVQPTARSQGVTAPAPALAGIHKIQHVIIIMQENRSFDSYFGTYPGADGIPMKGGKPTVCSPDPLTGQCVAPFVDHLDKNPGAPHKAADSVADVDGGKMDGFVAQQEAAKKGCASQFNPACGNGAATHDVMGYHDGREIPKYWAYAHDFVLQDHMFEPAASWSLPSHLFLVSGWSASCRNGLNPMSCRSNLLQPDRERVAGQPDYAWTDLTYLLHRDGVS